MWCLGILSYSTALPLFGVVNLFIFSYSGGYAYLVVLICIFLKTENVEDLFMCLFGCWHSYFVKCCWNILIGLFAILLLSCRSSLYIIHSSFCKIYVLKILSPSVTCLFIFNQYLLMSRVFSFLRRLICQFFFYQGDGSLIEWVWGCFFLCIFWGIISEG